MTRSTVEIKSTALKSRSEAIAAGDKHYLGKPCKHSHPGVRYTGDGTCVDCRRTSNERLAAAGAWDNRDRLNQKAKELFAGKSKGELLEAAHTLSNLANYQDVGLPIPRAELKLITKLLEAVAERASDDR